MFQKQEGKSKDSCQRLLMGQVRKEMITDHESSNEETNNVPDKSCSGARGKGWGGEQMPFFFF